MASRTMHPHAASTVPDDGGGIMSATLRATTVGVLALVSLHAFEALALTTVMPTIARELDGASLYAMAFTATLASGIVSIVWSGNLADRRGPLRGRPHHPDDRLALGLRAGPRRPRRGSRAARPHHHGTAAGRRRRAVAVAVDRRVGRARRRRARSQRGRRPARPVGHHPGRDRPRRRGPHPAAAHAARDVAGRPGAADRCR